eukprot:scaffold18985_cov39-Phaeocystis_antarctica.AAC.1
MSSISSISSSRPRRYHPLAATSSPRRAPPRPPALRAACAPLPPPPRSRPRAAARSQAHAAALTPLPRRCAVRVALLLALTGRSLRRKPIHRPVCSVPLGARAAVPRHLPLPLLPLGVVRPAEPRLPR